MPRRSTPIPIPKNKNNKYNYGSVEKERNEQPNKTTIRGINDAYLDLKADEIEDYPTFSYIPSREGRTKKFIKRMIKSKLLYCGILIALVTAVILRYTVLESKNKNTLNKTAGR
ncbi:hypothetical protein NEMIN01_2468 [Nematocida minor]|uniref:uncharacterized protein n=1 Tax=Nematocida minor TaxID=1912983 RepID=UPI00221F9550|nr:uncharacterized protein NEMIN01_2468 [Nematocida minor]KAI5193310.1 hypothetical protein NEMIN01_2468 [Nematocida minor]